MIESQLLKQVHQIALRSQRLRYRKSLAIGLSGPLLLGLLVIALAISGHASLAVAVPVICLGALIAFLFARLRASDGDDVLAAARLIEERYPSLDAKLLTALQQIKDAPPAGLGYLQQTVIHQSLDHSQQHDWQGAVPAITLRRWSLASGSAMLALLAMLITCIIAAQPFAAPMKAPTNLVSIPAVTAENSITVEPGDVSIERGSSLIITARFSQSIPASTSLILEGSSAALDGAITTRTLPMNASLDDPLVGARVPAITSDLTYRIIGQGVESSAYRVTVFDYPQLVQADASLTYPDYTALPVKLIEDTRQVTAVEGTRILWSLKLNKPITSAKLIAESGEAIVLSSKSGEATLVQGSLTLTQSQRYKLQLIDEAGRKNKHEVEFVMSALKNRPPDLKLVFPRRDLRVSPLEEAVVVAQAWDDFGVKQFGITYSLAGSEEKDVALASDLPGKANHEASHLLSFEAMNAVPDQLLSYHFWADDVGPDGQVRRTFSDMFFAEVRPFEEIFREGQAPPASEQQQQQQQQGQQQQIAEGIKEQREIISATWNLIRREIGAQPTSAFKADAQAIREAQEAALERMAQVKEALEDPQSLEHVEAVVKHMAQAVSHLATAADANDPASLKLALPAEQQAYQALLKLQAREHEVIRAQQQQQQRQQQGQQQQAGPSQQQLSELELRNQENRYETQKQAQEPQEDPQQRETRQALNRLRDLAKRQQDLNEKLKELDLALKEAQTQQEKEELARQLKRLREQQEEMLRDVDELRNRMEQANQQQQGQERQQQNQNSKQGEQSKQNEKQSAQNQQKQNEKQSPGKRRDQAKADDARQQVDEVRQNIREATEALEKGMTSKALTEGTRAERKLEELREEFRKRASGQFAEDVKEMREDARKLAGDQEKLGEKMKQLEKEGPRTLRDKGERKQVADALGDQKEKLEGLTDRMRRVTEEAEASQPLLSKQLYDTLRNADQQKVDQALDVTRQLLDKGFNEEAAAVEPQARKGLDDLKKGVEKAADSVLGDESESLRRARETLDDLARQVEREAPKNQQDQQLAQAAKRGEKQNDQAQPGGKGQAKQRQSKQGESESQTPDGRQAKGGDAEDKEDGDSPSEGGKQPGQSPADSQARKGKSSGEGIAQEPGNQSEKQPGQQSGEQAGEQPGHASESSQGKQASGGKSPSVSSSRGQTKAPSKDQPTLLDQLQQGSAQGGGSGPHGPITGENYREWSDQLRDVEEMIDDPNLREEVAKVRDRAQAMRAEFKRHGKEPQWDDVKRLVGDPLNSLRDRLDDELARRDQKRELVPIDRDPVPGQFTDLVREYYEKLGTGERNE